MDQCIVISSSPESCHSPSSNHYNLGSDERDNASRGSLNNFEDSCTLLSGGAQSNASNELKCQDLNEILQNENTCPDELIPTYYNKYLSKSEVLGRDWITKTLEQEIIALHPERSHISNDGKNVRCQTQFQRNVKVLFPPGRIFVNSTQIKQVADKFFSAWGMQSYSGGKSIKCYYARRRAQKVVVSRNASVKTTRNSATSLKEVFSCPFNIPFNWLPRNKDDVQKQENINRHVIVTAKTYNVCHSHELSPLYHRRALAKSGKLCIDLSKVKLTLHAIRHNPHMGTKELRPYLLDIVPSYQDISGIYCRNFRQRVQAYLFSQPENDELSMESAQLFFNGKSAANEYIDLDDPIVKINISKHFRNVLRNNNGSIHSVNFLQSLKDSIPGFDYRVKYDDEKIPEGFVWMTPNMRYNLIRYHDNIYLDAQCRKFNTSGYPYISPIVTNAEGKIGQTCESLIPEEELPEYIWIFKCMHEMEPRFLFKNIKYIFADRKITPSFLKQLGISETCTLRCDSYHMRSDVWPKSFGSYFAMLEPFLISMLESKKRREFNTAMSHAKEKVKYVTHCLEKLHDIERNASYYAGYYIVEKGGSLGKRGDAHAEQNHSSIVCYICDEVLVPICEHIRNLNLRNQDRVKKENKAHRDLRLSIQCFKSKMISPHHKRSDTNAKIKLSAKGYKDFFLETHERSIRLQIIIAHDSAICWPVNEDLNTSRHKFMFDTRYRCTCFPRTEYLIQCEHELLLKKGFEMDMYDKRWYNDFTYNEVSDYIDRPTQMDVLPVGQSNNFISTSDNIDYADVDDMGDNFSDNQDTSSQSNVGENSLETPETSTQKNILSYSNLISYCKRVVSTIQNNKSQMAKLFTGLECILQILRKGHDFELNIVTVTNSNTLNIETTYGSSMNSSIHNKSQLKRKQSQSKKSGAQKKLRHMSVQSSQDTISRGARSSTRSCRLCKQSGCEKFTCSKIKEYGIPLAKGNQTIRNDLGMKISLPDTYITDLLPNHLYSTVFSDVPCKFGAIILLRRYMREGLDITKKYVVKCIILNMDGDIMEQYENGYFQSGDLAKAINRSKSNIIISNLS